LQQPKYIVNQQKSEADISADFFHRRPQIALWSSADPPAALFYAKAIVN
jgi:hypothetical protein